MDKRAALADGIKRVRGTFDQANGFSRYLLFMIIMGVALYPHLPKRWRIPMLAGLGGLGVLMILTYTRSSWLALGHRPDGRRLAPEQEAAAGAHRHGPRRRPCSCRASSTASPT